VESRGVAGFLTFGLGLFVTRRFRSLGGARAEAVQRETRP
jgi:hypothetical protein